LWGEKGGEAVQVVRAVYCFGLALAPVVALPFIQDNPASDAQAAGTTNPRNESSLNITNNQMNITSDNSEGETNVMWLFPSVAAYILLVSVGHFLIVISSCSQGQIALLKTPKNKNDEVSESPRNFLLVLPHFLLCIFATGQEVVWIALGIAYFTMYLHWSTAEAALLLFVYQILKIFGSIISIGMIYRLGIRKTIAIQLGVMFTCSLLFLVFLTEGKYISYVYAVGTALAYVNVSLVLTWAKEIVPVSGKLAGAFTASLPISELAIPVIVSNLLVHYGRYVFPGMLMILIISGIIMAVIAWLMALLCPGLYKRQEENISLLNTMK
jgi:hypothetical protein